MKGVYALALVLAGFAAPGWAQEAADGSAPAATSQTPVLTLDWEQLYNNSLWGKRVAREIDKASSDLRTENNRIASQLEAEERDLTERRPKMAPADFQKAADAFDKRATEIRAAQKAKADAVQRQLNDERQGFVQAVMPKLDEVLRARGAEVVLDSRVIIRGLSSADVTEQLGKRIDREVGDGAGRVPASVPEPGSSNSASPSPADALPSDGTSDTGATDQGGVFVDDSPNLKPQTGADPALEGGSAPKASPPLGLPMPDPQN
ncbi:OmpH family outer membrane protein [Thioclava sp. BHET1]|nr:OmpH family outer membrane protein [Thioclava sp. BHET1]